MRTRNTTGRKHYALILEIRFYLIIMGDVGEGGTLKGFKVKGKHIQLGWRDCPITAACRMNPRTKGEIGK